MSLQPYLAHSQQVYTFFLFYSGILIAKKRAAPAGGTVLRQVQDGWLLYDVSKRLSRVDVTACCHASEAVTTFGSVVIQDFC